MDSEPDSVAAHDQAQVGAYFVQLTTEGVPEYEAMKLALAFQRRLIFPDVEAGPLDDDVDI